MDGSLGIGGEATTANPKEPVILINENLGRNAVPNFPRPRRHLTLSFIFKQIPQHIIQPKKQRRAVDGGSGEVNACYGEDAGEDFVRVEGGVVIEAISIALEDRAGFGGEVRFVLRVDHIPNVEQLHHVVVRRGIRAVDGGEFPARGKGDLLDGEEVVFRVGVGEAKGGVRVGDAEDMGHAPFIPQDADVVLFPEGEEGNQVRDGAGVEDVGSEGEEKEGKGEEKGAEGGAGGLGHGGDFIIDLRLSSA